jgi:hypothetical protein
VIVTLVATTGPLFGLKLFTAGARFLNASQFSCIRAVWPPVNESRQMSSP